MPEVTSVSATTPEAEVAASDVSTSDAPAQPVATIRGSVIDLQDPWQHFVASEEQPLPLEGGHWLVDQALWLEHEAALRARTAPVGLWVNPDDDVRELQDHLEGLALIAVDFPAFTDGRGFSSGHLLRTRLHWAGEMRAVGEIIIDTIHYLARCGFDAFTLKPGHDPQRALAQFQVFSVHYQRDYAQVPTGTSAA